MTAQAFIENYHANKLKITGGSLCFWGHCLGNPQDFHSLTSVQFNAEESLLTFIFSKKEKLNITNPTEIDLYKDHLEIRSADSVYFEWFDEGKPAIARNLFYYDFTIKGGKIIGKNNIHWSVINAQELSLQKPAVLMTDINRTHNN